MAVQVGPSWPSSSLWPRCGSGAARSTRRSSSRRWRRDPTTSPRVAPAACEWMDHNPRSSVGPDLVAAGVCPKSVIQCISYSENRFHLYTICVSEAFDSKLWMVYFHRLREYFSKLIKISWTFIYVFSPRFPNLFSSLHFLHLFFSAIGYV